MKISTRLFLLLSCLLPLPVALMAQLNPMGATLNNNASDKISDVWIVTGKVKTVQGLPVRGAVVIVTPTTGGANVRMLYTDPDGEFRTDYSLVTGITDREFSVTVTAKKKGFVTTHAYADYGKSVRTWLIPLTMRQPEEDPDVLSSQDLISSLAPRLKQLGPEERLAEKSEKEYARAVAAFLDQHDPERAVPLLAKVSGNNPSCIGCKMMLGLAELNWCDWNDSDQAIAQSVNLTLTNKGMGRPEPLVAYGTKLTWQHEPDKAEPYFRAALKYAPQDALTLQELGRTLLAMQKFGSANNILKKALDAGAGPEARLLYAQSWLGAGHPTEASAELNQYLNGRDIKGMLPRVRQLWVGIQDRQKVEATYAKVKPQDGEEIVDFLKHPPAKLIQGLDPATDQEQLGPILDAVGAKISQMSQDFPNTSSLEEIYQEKLGRKGKVSVTQSQKFRYLCVVPKGTWGPGFVEYRTDLAGNEASPKGLAEGFMLTKGFASAELIFHPAYRSESNFRYLGRQNLNGRNAYVVAFAQIPGKTHLSGKFRQQETAVFTLSQGLAWIDATTYQIIRLHTDLLAPLPELRLEGEDMDIDFNGVQFKSAQQTFWLPEDVTVTLNWNGKVLRNRHKYSDFALFSVNASQRIGKPKASSASSSELALPLVTE